jgi:hypothetical protein
VARYSRSQRAAAIRVCRPQIASRSVCSNRFVRPRAHLFADPDISRSRNLQANQEKRPTGTTPSASSCNCRLAGPVPLRFWALRVGANEERLLCTLRSASTELLLQRDRAQVWGECTEGGSHYRIRIQPIIHRFIDREVPSTRNNFGISSRVNIPVCIMRRDRRNDPICGILDPAIARTIRSRIEDDPGS